MFHPDIPVKVRLICASRSQSVGAFNGVFILSLYCGILNILTDYTRSVGRDAGVVTAEANA